MEKFDLPSFMNLQYRSGETFSYKFKIKFYSVFLKSMNWNQLLLITKLKLKN